MSGKKPAPEPALFQADSRGRLHRSKRNTMYFMYTELSTNETLVSDSFLSHHNQPDDKKVLGLTPVEFACSLSACVGLSLYINDLIDLHLYLASLERLCSRTS